MRVHGCVCKVVVELCALQYIVCIIMAQQSTALRADIDFHPMDLTISKPNSWVGNGETL